LKPWKYQIAVCGLDCGSCDIRQVPVDPNAARKVIAWFKEMGWHKEGEDIQSVVDKAPYCRGCRGDRAVHWSSNYWISKCCVDDKGLEFCYECTCFPCNRIVEWSEGSERYWRALEFLKKLKEEALK